MITKLNPVRWQSLRSLARRRLFAPLLQFMVTGDLPPSVPRKLAARIRALAPRLLLDGEEMYLITGTPFPEHVDQSGKAVVEMGEPHRLRVVSPDEVEDVMF